MMRVDNWRNCMKLMLKVSLILLTVGCLTNAKAQSGIGLEERNKPVYHIAFVHAKPGKEREYRKFVVQVFKPMWIAAVKAGVVESWAAYEHPVYFGKGAGYTHILVVKMKNFAGFDSLIPDLLTVVSKQFPGRDVQAEAQELMEIVRSDVFYEFASTAEAKADTKSSQPK
jgi:hypothetical protein